jgi:hypothetical protein
MMRKFSLIALTFMFCAILNAQESANHYIENAWKLVDISGYCSQPKQYSIIGAIQDDSSSSLEVYGSNSNHYIVFLPTSESKS